MLVAVRLIIDNRQVIALDRADHAMSAIVAKYIAGDRQEVRIVVRIEPILNIIRKGIVDPAHTVAAEGIATEVVMVERAATHISKYIGQRIQLPSRRRRIAGI